jgi:hypothetical protein
MSLSLSLEFMASELMAAKAALAQRDAMIAERDAMITDLRSARPVPIAAFLALPKYADFVKGVRIKKSNIGPEWQEGVTEYNRFFPYPASARVYVEAAVKGKYIEIALNHHNKTYSADGFSADSPTKMMESLHDKHFIGRSPTATAWQNMLVSMDGGNTYIVGKDLQDQHIAHFGKERKKVSKSIAPRT